MEHSENTDFKTIYEHEPRMVYICEDKTSLLKFFLCLLIFNIKIGPNQKVRIKAIPICHQNDFKTAQNEAELTFILEGNTMSFLESFRS